MKKFKDALETAQNVDGLKQMATWLAIGMISIYACGALALAYPTLQWWIPWAGGALAAAGLAQAIQSISNFIKRRTDNGSAITT